MPDIPFTIPPSHRHAFPGTRGRGGIYSRVSSESDLRTTSFEVQVQGGIDAFSRDGFYLEPADICAEQYSGVNSVAVRSGLQEMLRLIGEGYYQAFYFHDPDRLCRGMEVAQIIIQVEEAGCVVYIDGQISEPSPERDLILVIKGYAAAKEAKRIAKRTTDARHKLWEQGVWVGAGGPRYGLVFDKITRTRSICPTYGPIVIIIFEMIAAGHSTIYVAKWLNDEGIKAPGVVRASARRIAQGTDKKYLWSAARVGLIIKEETYVGKAYRNRYRYKTDAKGRVLKEGKRSLTEAVPRSEWIETAIGQTPALVSQDLFDRANAALAAGSTKKKIDETRNARQFYLLRGFIYCAGCLQRMHTTLTSGCAGGNRTKYPVYRCRTKYNPFHGHAVCTSPTVHAAKLERKARATIDWLLSQPDLVDDSIEQAYRLDGQEESIARNLARTTASIAKLKKKSKAHLGDLDDGDLIERTRKAIRNQMVIVDTEIESLEGLADEYRQQLVPLRNRDKVKRAHMDRCADVRDKLAGKASLTDREYRDAMTGLGVRFYFSKEELTVELQPGGAAGSITGLPDSSSARRSRKYINPFRTVTIDVSALDDSLCV